jgi:hypothetical protein
MTLALHPCTPPEPVAVAPSTVEPSPLVRFVALGLLATVDCHLAGGLAPGRVGWELSARIEQLAALGLPPRTVTRLRWLARAAALPAEPAPSDLVALRTAIVGLLGDEGA